MKSKSNLPSESTFLQLAIADNGLGMMRNSSATFVR